MAGREGQTGSRPHRPPSRVGATVVDRAGVRSALEATDRVAVVQAPAGFGKTTAVRAWAEASSAPVAWVDAGAFEAHPAVFWRAFFRAVREAVPAVDDEPALALAERAPGDPYACTVLLEQVRDRAPAGGAVGRPTVVVDGLWDPHADLQAGLARVVDDVGAHLRLVLVGRPVLPLPLTRWRTLGWLTEVDERQLRFTADDVAALVALVAPAVPLAAAQDFARRMDGWPLGVRLGLQWAAEHPGAELPETVGRVDRALADHLVLSVVDRLAPHEQEVLRELAVFDAVGPDLCRQVVGAAGTAVVARLCRRGLLVEDRAGDTVRVQPLISAVLLDDLRWCDDERRRALHERAADLLRVRGDLDGAYRQLVAAGRGVDAADLVLEPVLRHVDTGDRKALRTIIDGLPPTMNVRTPALAVDLAYAHLFAARTASARAWADRAEAMAGADAAIALRVAGFRATASMLDGHFADAAVQVARFEVIGAHQPPEGIEVRSATVGARVALATGRVDEAARWLERGRGIEAPPVITEVALPALEAWAMLADGRPVAALRAAAIARDAAERLGARPHIGASEAMAVHADALLACGRLVEAAALMDGLRADADELGQPWTVARAGILAAELERLAGRPMGALAILDELRSRLSRRRSPDFLVAVDLLHARVVAGVDPATALDLLMDLPHGAEVAVVRARALMARDGAASTAEVLGLLADRRSWSGRTPVEADVLWAVALHDADGLAHVVAVAARAGWVAPFLAEVPVVNAALAALPLARLHPALHEHFVGARAPGNRSTGAAPLLEALTSRELSVLELLPSHLSYAQIGERLYISVNTVKSNLKAVYRKLGVASRHEAVEAARMMGILTS